MRVTIAEDSGLLREAIGGILGDEGFEVLDMTPDAETLLASLARNQPDVCILDVRMPPTFTDEGIRAALEIRRRWPAIGLLILSQQVEASYAAELVANGVAGIGYLLKDKVGDIDEFLRSVERVAAGGTVLDAAVISEIVTGSGRRNALEGLTRRELEVLKAMAQGLSNAGIAHDLSVGEGAVEKHITSIFGKLGLRTDIDEHRRVQAVLTFLRESGRR